MVDWKNPYAKKGKYWLKGNLHTHTNVSHCGHIPPGQVIANYEKMGYDFISINDHGVVWRKRAKTGINILPGIEIDFQRANHTGVVHVSAKKIKFSPKWGQQKIIDENVRQGGVVVINHPDWQIEEHAPLHRLQSLRHYTGIEIYNSVIERLTGSPLSTAKWDRLLSNGRKVLGFSNQDSHQNMDYKDCCNVVQTAEKNKRSIFNSIKSGNFYCYYGVKILKIGRSNETIRIKTSNARLIRFVGHAGVILKKTGSKSASISFNDFPNTSYIRIECLGVGEEISWSQPFFR